MVQNNENIFPFLYFLMYHFIIRSIKLYRIFNFSMAKSENPIKIAVRNESAIYTRVRVELGKIPLFVGTR